MLAALPRGKNKQTANELIIFCCALGDEPRLASEGMERPQGCGASSGGLLSLSLVCAGPSGAGSSQGCLSSATEGDWHWGTAGKRGRATISSCLFTGRGEPEYGPCFALSWIYTGQCLGKGHFPGIGSKGLNARDAKEGFSALTRKRLLSCI